MTKRRDVPAIPEDLIREGMRLQQRAARFDAAAVEAWRRDGARLTPKRPKKPSAAHVDAAAKLARMNTRVVRNARLIGRTR